MEGRGWEGEFVEGGEVLDLSVIWGSEGEGDAG